MKKNTDLTISEISDALLNHAALGNGYTTDTPIPKGLVFSAATDGKAVAILAQAESRFQTWHNSKIEEDKKALKRVIASLKAQPDDPDLKRLKEEIEDRIGGIPNLTWKEDQVTKSSLVDVLSRSFYNAFTYVDAVGARLAGALSSSPARLASDLSWSTLTHGTTDETLIRSSGAGGTLIRSLAGKDTRFNHFCCTKPEDAEHLADRVKNTTSGRVAQGKALIIPNRPEEYNMTGSDVLFTMMSQVYVRGHDDAKKMHFGIPSHQLNKWQEFFAWGVEEIVTGEELTDWQRLKLLGSPASPQNVVESACQVVITKESERLAQLPGNLIPEEVVLTLDHLESAKQIARLLYEDTSGIKGLRKRIDNLKDSKSVFLSDSKIEQAKIELEDYFSRSEKMSRRTVRDLESVTLGIVDELVRQEFLVELMGKQECQMGNTRRAYVLKTANMGIDPLEALDEFEEAECNFQEAPDAYTNVELFAAYDSIQAKAEEMDRTELLPVVPLSRMSKSEIRALPTLLRKWEGHIHLRGAGRMETDPIALLNEADGVLDVEGLNLWVRSRKDGSSFRTSWEQSVKLGLGHVFSDIKIA